MPRLMGRDAMASAGRGSSGQRREGDENFDELVEASPQVDVARPPEITQALSGMMISRLQ